MPFVSNETLEALKAENEALSESLRRFEEMGPHIALAEELRGEITKVLIEQPEIPGSEIGELAYRLVLDRKIEDARDEIVAQYEQTHRAQLYEQVIEEVRAEEGIDISADVRTKVETDPKIATELRDSARRELAARALGVVRHAITEEQRVVIEKETSRQIALDRLDVEFALDGVLDLTRKDILDLLTDGDVVLLYFKGAEGTDNTLTLKWCTDAKGKSGWVFQSCDIPIYNGPTHLNPSKSQHIYPVTLNKDMSNGSDVVQMDTISKIHPFGYAYSRSPKKKSDVRKLTTRTTSYNPTSKNITLTGTDFRTKTLDFYHMQPDQK